MRKLVWLGMGVATAALFTVGRPNPAVAWCHGGYLYDYECASPAYRFALSPWGYRTAYQGVDSAGWAWRGWGYQPRDLRQRSGQRSGQRLGERRWRHR
jgi:hypothetical protein